MKNPKVPDDSLPNLIVWYNLEANSIVVNLDQVNIKQKGTRPLYVLG